MSEQTIGVIVGNRDFFPDVLIQEARKDITKVLNDMNMKAVMFDENQGKLGAVETWEHAKACAALFDEHRHDISGILVVLPNFGDEKGIADTIKLSGLNVPVLVQAYPDDINQFNVERRRDAFCGKISVCNNLRQYDIPYSLTSRHTMAFNDDDFKQDLKSFLGVCRVVNGMQSARFGAIGARPSAFNTVRFSEKLLQDAGISVSTIDFSEVFGKANNYKDNDGKVEAKIEEIKSYANAENVPLTSLILMAKLGLVIDEWMAENDLNATAIQCWTSLQSNYGINVCTLMSMMSHNLMPSACEVDITGVASMYALQLASGKPSALVDWNNNYGDDPDKCVFFHCGNWPKEFLPNVEIKTAEILGTITGEENTYGALAGRTPAGPVTFARISTDDVYGEIRAYVGEGEFTDDPLDTFGARAVVHVPNLQPLMRYICDTGFEHHCAMNADHVADIIEEAFVTYLHWDIFRTS